jgi:pyridoxine 5-phosphate synthase
VLEATRVCLEAGAPGVTVHPRADARHITERDVRDVAGLLRDRRGGTEFNIEGDPRPELLALVHDLLPTQCTIVPVQPGEITSQAGWPPDTPRDAITSVVRDLRNAGVRVSLFVEPEEAPIRWAKEVGADRVELYTEPFARAFERGAAAVQESFRGYTAAAELAHALGLGINAGHDLDLENLVLFRTLPHLQEVSIGHALVSHALFVGLDRSVREYVSLLRH